jgi:hypothetical protein
LGRGRSRVCSPTRGSEGPTLGQSLATASRRRRRQRRRWPLAAPSLAAADATIRRRRRDTRSKPKETSVLLQFARDTSGGGRGSGSKRLFWYTHSRFPVLGEGAGGERQTKRGEGAARAPSHAAPSACFVFFFFCGGRVVVGAVVRMGRTPLCCCKSRKKTDEMPGRPVSVCVVERSTVEKQRRAPPPSPFSENDKIPSRPDVHDCCDGSSACARAREKDPVRGESSAKRQGG